MPHNFLFSGWARKTGKHSVYLILVHRRGECGAKNHVETGPYPYFIIFHLFFVTIIVFVLGFINHLLHFIDIVALLPFPGNKRFFRNLIFHFPVTWKLGRGKKRKDPLHLSFGWEIDTTGMERENKNPFLNLAAMENFTLNAFYCFVSKPLMKTAIIKLSQQHANKRFIFN